MLRVFGATPGGQRACLHLHGLTPYFYVRYDRELPQARAHAPPPRAALTRACPLAGRARRGALRAPAGAGAGERAAALRGRAPRAAAPPPRLRRHAAQGAPLLRLPRGRRALRARRPSQPGRGDARRSAAAAKGGARQSFRRPRGARAVHPAGHDGPQRRGNGAAGAAGAARAVQRRAARRAALPPAHSGAVRPGRERRGGADIRRCGCGADTRGRQRRERWHARTAGAPLFCSYQRAFCEHANASRAQVWTRACAASGRALCSRGVARQTTCELEADALFVDVLNRNEVLRVPLADATPDMQLMQSLAPLWAEERLRAAAAGLPLPRRCSSPERAPHAAEADAVQRARAGIRCGSARFVCERR